MTGARWEQLAASSGIAFVALFIAGTALDPVVDPGGETANVVARQILDNQERTLGSAYAVGFAGLAFVWFAGALRAFLRRHDTTGRLSAVAFGGGVIGGAVLVISAVLRGTALELADRARNAETTQIANLLGQSLTFIGIAFAAALLVGATVLLSFRTGALPRWLGVLGAVGAALGLVYFWPINVLGGMLTLIWIIATSIVLMQRVGVAQAEPAPLERELP